MPVTRYDSTHPSAPVLTSAAGSFIALLDAVLVNGYGGKPGLGWTKAFSGTNIAVYRNSTALPESTGMYLRVNDTSTSLVAIRAYKTMSDINTGTDMIPNPAAMNNTQTDIYIVKQVSTGEKRWGVLGDERTVYGWNTPSTTNANNYSGLWGFGDYISYVPSNTWNYMIFGNGENSTTGVSRFPDSPGNTTNRNMFLGRSQVLLENQPAYGQAISLSASEYSSTSTTPGSNNGFPLSIYTGLVFMTNALIMESGSGFSISGELRGCMYHAGRSTGNIMENFGKSPLNPTGPDYYQMVSFNGSGTSTGSLLVAGSDWNG